jgi:hypothetical protein
MEDKANRMFSNPNSKETWGFLLIFQHAKSPHGSQRGGPVHACQAAQFAAALQNDEADFAFGKDSR